MSDGRVGGRKVAVALVSVAAGPSGRRSSRTSSSVPSGPPFSAPGTTSPPSPFPTSSRKSGPSRAGSVRGRSPRAPLAPVRQRPSSEPHGPKGGGPLPLGGVSPIAVRRDPSASMFGGSPDFGLFGAPSAPRGDQGPRFAAAVLASVPRRSSANFIMQGLTEEVDRLISDYLRVNEGYC